LRGASKKEHFLTGKPRPVGGELHLIFDTMENVFRMEMIGLGSLNLLEHLVDVTEGLRACQDYGRAVGEKLGK